MTTIFTEVYSTSELSPAALQKAINDNRYINVDYWEWYHKIYDNAEELGIKIESFNLHRHDITGVFIIHSTDVATKITKTQDADSELYKLSKAFLSDYFVDDIDDDAAKDLEEDYKQSILEEFRIMLQHELEYLTSDEAVLDSLCDTDFDINGIAV
jgi:hypothetical protein